MTSNEISDEDEEQVFSDDAADEATDDEGHLLKDDDDDLDKNDNNNNANKDDRNEEGEQGSEKILEDELAVKSIAEIRDTVDVIQESPEHSADVAKQVHILYRIRMFTVLYICYIS